MNDTFDLFQNMLEGEPITGGDIEGFANRRIREDQYLEYKSGKLAKDAKKLRADVRRVIAGFANSQGGILLVGVDENTWSIDGFQAPGGIQSTDWAIDVLRDLAPALVRGFSVRSFEIGVNQVLAIAVARSDAFVHVSEQGQMVYYLRFGEDTLPAPTYLVQDLILGRRSKAEVDVAKYAAIGFSLHNSVMWDDLRWLVQLDIENGSLVWAPDVMVGLIGYSCGEAGSVPVSRHLGRLIDIDRSIETVKGWQLAHFSKSLGQVRPFDSITTKLGPLLTPFGRNLVFPSYKWRGAFYLVVENAAPRWYSVTLNKSEDLSRDLYGLFKGQSSAIASDRFWAIEPMANERPRISVERDGW